MPDIRNLDYLRSLSSKEFPDLGAKLYEALTDIAQRHANIEQQTNSNSAGQPVAPPAIAGVHVTGQNGFFHVAIKDEGQIYRGVHYYAEYSTSPHFTDPQVVPMGDSRNHTMFLGKGNYYWRAYSAYASSPPSAPAYHGGQSIPQAVDSGGQLGGPALQQSQGSGTGTPGQGVSGPGPVPFRSADGTAPVRGSSGSGAAGAGRAVSNSPASPTVAAGGSPVGGQFTGLNDLNRVLKVSPVGSIGESSITDDGVSVSTTEPINTASVYEVGGVQVVGAQMIAVPAPTGGGTAVSAPSGGTVIDVQARAAISSIIAAIAATGNTVDPVARLIINDIRVILSAALGGHGLTA